MSAAFHLGNCLDTLKAMPDNSVDSIVTDPPYGLSFMGKKWDYDVPSVEIWAECLRVLKPGGHLLAFAGTRTQHRMAVRIEDAGFEIRDMLAWVYGSGFPKSHNVSKALDGVSGKQGKGFKAAGDDGRNADFQQDLSKRSDYGYKYTPTTDAAKQWEGWGTALKPALEPITLARKPLMGTVAENVLEHGTGGLNIDGCRVGLSDGDDPRLGGAGSWITTKAQSGNTVSLPRGEVKSSPLGRWPANFIHDGSDEVVGLFPQSVARPIKPENIGKSGDGTKKGLFGNGSIVQSGYYDTETSASRFFYCAKASKRDRNEGCEQFAERQVFGDDGGTYQGLSNSKNPDRNIHPTVKPTELMRYLCRLITPPNGVILDPFMGSGSTGKAALLEGFRFIGCELSPEYFEIAKARIASAQAMPKQQDLFS